MYETPPPAPRDPVRSFRLLLKGGLAVFALAELFNLWLAGPRLWARWRLGCPLAGDDRAFALLVVGGPLLGIAASAALLYASRRARADRPPSWLGAATAAYQLGGFVCVTWPLSALADAGSALERIARC
ncbi:MAG TPA: hypothetical protein VGE07_20110 [Herpetosiphonaceae bacterium]